MRPQYSVVIPTYNRLDTLPEVLQALEYQAEAPPFEVIVVDDGSTDGTPSWLSGYRPDRLELRCFHQPNSGPALARNHGVAEARGARVAFLGDDTVPHQHVCRGNLAESSQFLSRLCRGTTCEVGRMPLLLVIKNNGVAAALLTQRRRARSAVRARAWAADQLTAVGA